MMSSTFLLCLALLAIGICSAMPEGVKSDTSGVKTTRAPHTHEEHPPEDDDHSDHAHDDAQDLKAPKPEEEHDHPGHDHSPSGHDHSVDHPVEEPKAAEETKTNQLEEANKAGEGKIKEEENIKTAERGLWKRRLE